MWTSDITELEILHVLRRIVTRKLSFIRLCDARASSRSMDLLYTYLFQIGTCLLRRRTAMASLCVRGDCAFYNIIALGALLTWNRKAREGGWLPATREGRFVVITWHRYATARRRHRCRRRHRRSTMYFHACIRVLHVHEFVSPKLPNILWDPRQRRSLLYNCALATYSVTRARVSKINRRIVIAKSI